MPATDTDRRDRSGVRESVRIVSDAYLATDRACRRIAVSALLGLCDGVICLSGGPRGPIGSAFGDDHAELAEGRLSKLNTLFDGRLYVELERVGDYDRAIEQTSNWPTASNCRLSPPTRHSFVPAKTLTRTTP
jgi:DNA polymerase III alpha subunit